jgi:hypothetical protein
VTTVETGDLLAHGSDQAFAEGKLRHADERDLGEWRVPKEYTKGNRPGIAIFEAHFLCELLSSDEASELLPNHKSVKNSILQFACSWLFISASSARTPLM